MNKHFTSDIEIDDERKARFLDFMRRISPGSDPNTALLFGQISKANRLLVQAVEKRLEDAGVSWNEFRILLSLMRNENLGGDEGLQPSELSEMEGIPRNSMSGLLDSLEAADLVHRELHPTDRRKFVIRLSPKGRALLEANLDSQFKFLTGCFAAFTPDERDTLRELLTRLNLSLVDRAKAAAGT